MTRSLEGRVVLVTRPADRSSGLAALLEERGARVVFAPAISIEPADGAGLSGVALALAEGSFAWVVLTSRAGVEALARAMDGRVLRARVAAVGEGTARALRSYGIEPDLVPPTFTTEALGDAFPAGSGRVALARTDIAPPGLEAAIAAKGWSVERVDAYRTRSVRTLSDRAAEALDRGEVDAVTFTSASTVRGFLDAARSHGLLDVPPAVCIGPVTARAARRAGFEVSAEASPHTIEGLVGALERVFGAVREDPEHR